MADSFLDNKLINLDFCVRGSEFYAISKTLENSDNNILYIAKDEQIANEVYNVCAAYIKQWRVLYFPSWDTLPYELSSPSQQVMSKRIFALHSLAASPTRTIVITSVAAVMQKIPLPSEILAETLSLKVKQKYNREDLVQYLVNHNYMRTATADSVGEFAVRGSIIDIVSSSSDLGYRIDFFGNEIEHIKQYDIETQLTCRKIDEFTIFPSSELILTKKNVDRFKQEIISKYGALALQSDALQNIERGKLRFIGVEQWLPMFYTELTDIFQYLGKKTNIMLDHQTMLFLNSRFDFVQQYYQERLEEVKRDKKICSDPLLPEKLYSNYNLALNNNSPNNIGSISSVPNLIHLAQQQNVSALKLLAEFIANTTNSFIISCATLGTRDRVQRILQDHDIDTVINDNWDNLNAVEKNVTSLVVSPIEYGFICNEFTLLTEREIFGEKVQNIKIRKQKSFQQLIEQANIFSVGENIVHVDHGIGRFEGLETVALQNTKHDCLKIQYDGGDILYVPVENIEVLSKYGIEGEVKLDKLGHASWQARKAKMRNRIKLSAEYLLGIAAQRYNKSCDVIIPSIGLYDEFCATFPHVETDDQLNAIEAIAEDLASGKPMDRLVCGDVGFGKTEVAIRAAFMVLKTDDHVKRQVALICPTTLLCKQHFKSFSQRFKGFDINIRQLSRFVSTKESKQTIADLNDGKVDIVICTHALLNSSLKFKNLALLIIDEEQHFGVVQKEKLKEKRTDVHVLSLSATPIPRTLQMSLTGIKELSIIATPPVDRLVTKTSVMPFDSIIIKEAILREFQSGGQVFYVCPRIKDIDDVLNIVTSLTPSLKVAIAHGQMAPAKLENLMHDFYDHKYDLLISTSIIESGLDLSTANTIIVHRADKFGLSQLYQLRGRVGRGKSKSYAYFTIPNKDLSPVVIKRLEILQNIDSLGAGFSVASHDMDVRGFGNLLGDEQSGHIEEVGIELYQEMLQQALLTLKADKNIETVEEKWVPQINLGISILIPEAYISDLELRLNLYQRISNLEHEDEIEGFAAEMIDRFGPLPEEFNHLIAIVKLKRLCITHHIKKIDAGPKAILFEFCSEKFTKSEQILTMAKAQPGRVKLRPDNKLILAYSIDDAHKRIELIEKFIRELTQ